MLLFGDPATFAIAFGPYEGNQNEQEAFAYCHFIFGEHFIGDPNEPCFLSTWVAGVRVLLDRIQASRGALVSPLFEGLADREVFELIFKSNALEEDFKESFAYLPPQPTNALWAKHHMSIDETLDAYLLVFLEADGMLKFLGEGWRSPCPKEKIGKLFSTLVDHDFFVATVKTFLSYLKENYPRIEIKL